MTRRRAGRPCLDLVGRDRRAADQAVPPGTRARRPGEIWRQRIERSEHEAVAQTVLERLRLRRVACGTGETTLGQDTFSVHVAPTASRGAALSALERVGTISTWPRDPCTILPIRLGRACATERTTAPGSERGSARWASSRVLSSGGEIRVASSCCGLTATSAPSSRTSSCPWRRCLTSRLRPACWSDVSHRTENAGSPAVRCRVAIALWSSRTQADSSCHI